MGNKSSKKRKADTISGGDRLMVELGADPNVWSIKAGYGKGPHWGDCRNGTVTVRYLPSGRMKSTWFYSAGKAAARREAVSIAKRFMKELVGSLARR